MELQKVFEGATVYVQGYKMTATNVIIDRYVDFSTKEKVVRVGFNGVMDECHKDSPLYNTGYNGGFYAGNHLAYDFADLLKNEKEGKNV